MISARHASANVRLRWWLLAGAAVFLMLGSSAEARSSAALKSSAAKTASERDALDAARAAKPEADQAGANSDGLDPGSFYLEADTLQQDDDNKTVTATGHVEVRYRGRTLRAQTLIYNTVSGEVSASGDVVVVNPDGTAEFAKEIVLDKDMSAGVALGFSARLQGNVKIAADSVIRRSADKTELNRAIYTPCDICAKDGQPKHPTWSIRADQVIQDKAHHLVFYKHAVISVLGVPVLYTPTFWHPDNESKAQSGFLTPLVGVSNKRGFSYEQPYLFVVSPSEDLVLSPVISSKVNPFVNMELRKRFNSGEVDARFGYTYEREFDNSGHTIPGTALTSRSYVLASGAFDINSKWSWGFGSERVSDDLLFDRYDTQGVYDRRGLFETDSRRLLSQVYAVRQDQTSYLSVSALDFEGLRIGDVNSAMPVVAPLIEARYEPSGAILGGRLRLTGSGVILTRDQDPNDPALPGTDSRRATGQIDWRGAYTVGPGLRIEPFGSGRFDVYRISDPVLTPKVQTVSRAIGSVGVDFSLPMIRRSGDTTVILEPLVEGVYSPKANPSPDIPNQDSADFVFDETNLFDPNRTPGFDVFDSGARLNVGGRATVDWGDGQQARAFVGRSLRASPDPTLPVLSGYTARSSDWILAASAAPMKGLEFYERTQLDGDTFALRRQEVGFNIITSFARGYFRYLHDYTNPSGHLENLEAAGDILVTKHFGLVLYGERDLQNSVWARRDIGLLYQDECTRLEIVYHHEAAFARLGGPSNSVQVRLTLATLGEQGYRSDDNGR